MKKLILFALVIAITSVFVFGVFLATNPGVAFAGNSLSSVSWNMKVSEASAVNKPAQVAVFFDLPIQQPNIGWNS